MPAELFRRSLAHEGSWPGVIAKWGLPGVAMSASQSVCVWLLHVATYHYVREMLAWEQNYEIIVNPEVNASINNLSSQFSFGLTPDQMSFGSLNDPIEQMLGSHPTAVGNQAFEFGAALFPALFGLTAILTDDIFVWTKVMICNSFLALGKGFFAAMTTVPDSRGWSACKESLNTPGSDGTGIEWLNQSRSLWDLFELEFQGVHGHDLRWCADMMWSGSTYFVCLYALGFYELVRNRTRGWAPQRRNLVLFVVGTAGLAEQGLEAYLTLINRFHYSSDVVVAIFMTLLFYTSGPIAVAAKWWTRTTCFAKTRENGDRNQPLLSNEVSRCVVKDLDGKENKAESEKYVAVNIDNLRSDGDVFLPPCCVPFCCLAGQEHIFSDEEILSLLEQAPPHQKQAIMDQMLIGHHMH